MNYQITSIPTPSLFINPSSENLDWNSRGKALNCLRWYKEALDAYDKAIAIEPNYKEAMRNWEDTYPKVENKPTSSPLLPTTVIFSIALICIVYFIRKR